MNEQALRGSCLCGAVSYRVDPPFLRFAHCHCRRCCKATGSAHATNLYVAPASFAWTSGEDSVVRYDLPSARSFATTFCKHCGAKLPHHTRSRREVVIPAGSLDVQPAAQPRGRIFWDSRVPWTCADELPTFAEYAPWW